MPKPLRGGPYLIDMALDRSRVPSFDDYPFRLPAVRGLGTLAFHPQVTFFVGENGSGKSTLLEGLAAATDLNPEGGSRNFDFKTRSSHSNLAGCLRVARTGSFIADAFFLRAETFYNVATEVERLNLGRNYGGKSLHEQSHGESFFALFEERFRGDGLYLLDEPEAALSPTRQLGLLALMHRYCLAGAQFIIATHSPIILAYPDSTIYHLDAAGVRPVAYEETEHYKVTKAFLMRPKVMLAELFADDDG